MLFCFQLFGPRWNNSVPRFAANLGFSPLEPVRASETHKAPLSSIEPSDVIEVSFYVPFDQMFFSFLEVEIVLPKR